MLAKEAVVMAKWLRSVTVKVAHDNPADEHAASLGCRKGPWPMIWALLRETC